MRDHLPLLVFLIPFLAAISLPMIGLIRRRWCWAVAVGSLLLMTFATWRALLVVWADGPIRYFWGGWEPPYGVEWLLDGLSAVVLFMISGLSLLAVIYARPSVERFFPGRTVPFYTLVLLLISSLAGILLSADLFNIFVFLEVASLCGYALVGLAGGRGLLSAFRYLIMGTIGASFYLLGVGYLYASTGTLNMADLALRLSDLFDSRAALTGIVFIMIGIGIKTALIPLHGWLPDAYAHAPLAVSPLLAALMTKVSLYLLIRITFLLMGVETLTEKIPFLVYMGWIGVLATLVGAFLALSEQNLKRMFAYGGLSHIGLVVLAVSFGNETGIAGSIFYLINDAAMQAGLFFVAGTLVFRHGVVRIADLAQISGALPWTLTALIVTALSMVGIPPTGGFFGKWYLILAAMEVENYLAVGVIILSTILTLAYFARILEKILMESRQTATSSELEAPTEMRFSMAMITGIILALGIFSDPLIQMIQEIALPSVLG